MGIEQMIEAVAAGESPRRVLKERLDELTMPTASNAAKVGQALSRAEGAAGRGDVPGFISSFAEVGKNLAVMAGWIPQYGPKIMTALQQLATQYMAMDAATASLAPGSGALLRDAMRTAKQVEGADTSSRNSAGYTAALSELLQQLAAVMSSAGFASADDQLRFRADQLAKASRSFQLGYWR